MSTINGNSARGTDIFNNGLDGLERLTYIKDPDTGRRRSRQRAAGEQVVTKVPELQIIDDALWQATRARQTALRQGFEENDLSSMSTAASRPL